MNDRKALRDFQVEIRPGSKIIAKSRDISYKLENAFKEFVDNSSQSFLTTANREILLKEFQQKCCTMTIEITNEKIVIEDNAFGMKEEDFRRAVKLDSPPEDTSGRNEKGMGLKNAATWLGNFWSIETTLFGSNEMFYAEMNIDQIEKDSPETIQAKSYEVDRNAHYTKITIMRLNKKTNARSVESLKKNLALLFNRDIKNGDLEIIINEDKLSYSEPEIRKDDNGNDYLNFFEGNLNHEGKTYGFQGWIGILNSGSRSEAGFSLLQKNRAIQMNYRPKKLFGDESSFPYQRIIGEIEFSNDWRVSNTKDCFIWDGDLEDTFIDVLSSLEPVKEMIDISKKPWNETKISEPTKKKIIKSIQKSFEVQNLLPPQTKVVFEEKINEEFKPITITFDQEKYHFSFKFANNIRREWFTISYDNGDKHHITITIDNTLPFFASSFSASETTFIMKFLVVLTLARIRSSNNDIGFFLDTLNTIISTLGDSND